MAATSRSPQVLTGPGITRCCSARADATVVRTAPQSDITSPSKPHSPVSGSASSGFSLIVAPLTAL